MTDLLKDAMEQQKKYTAGNSEKLRQKFRKIMVETDGLYEKDRISVELLV